MQFFNFFLWLTLGLVVSNNANFCASSLRQFSKVKRITICFFFVIFYAFAGAHTIYSIFQK